MAKSEQKTMMPGSTAGLVRYFDTENKGFKMKPTTVIWVSVLFSSIVVVMKFLGA